MSNQKRSVDVKLMELRSGLQKNQLPVAQIPVGSKVYDQPGLLQLVDGQVTPFEVEEASRQDHATKLAARKAAQPGEKITYRNVVATLRVIFADNPEALANFGISPPKPRQKPTAEELVKRAARAGKTRELRGTKGPKAKAKIKATGEVTVSTVLADGTGSASEANGSAPAAAQPADATNGGSH